MCKQMDTKQKVFYRWISTVSLPTVCSLQVFQRDIPLYERQKWHRYVICYMTGTVAWIRALAALYIDIFIIIVICKASWACLLFWDIALYKQTLLFCLKVRIDWPTFDAAKLQKSVTKWRAFLHNWRLVNSKDYLDLVTFNSTRGHVDNMLLSSSCGAGAKLSS